MVDDFGAKSEGHSGKIVPLYAIVIHLLRVSSETQ